jgi:hypothetical protein
MDIIVASQPGKILHFLRSNSQEMLQFFGGIFDLQPLSKFRILGGDTYRTLAGVTQTVLLACTCHQGCSAYCYGIGSHWAFAKSEETLRPL